jgi:hypothetical protein
MVFLQAGFGDLISRLQVDRQITSKSCDGGTEARVCQQTARDNGNAEFGAHLLRTGRGSTSRYSRSRGPGTGLENLVDALASAQSDPTAIAAATVAFLGEVCKGFSPTAFGDRFKQEVRDGCARPCRGKPAEIQNLARFLVNEPNHCGVAKVLRRLSELASNDPHFTDVKIDCHREFWEAGCLGDFENAEAGLAEIAHRRTYSRPKPPNRAISSIHKAKGLECDSVIVLPCDAETFPDSEYTRCLLYVTISRAKSRLMLVLSRAQPSPLFTI